MPSSQLRALKTLYKIQKKKLDDKCIELSHTLAQEEPIRNAISNYESELLENQTLMSDKSNPLISDMSIWRGYLHWLPLIKENIQKEKSNLMHAQINSDNARFQVALARKELRSTESLIEKLENEEKEHQQRYEQNSLDEFAQRMSKENKFLNY